MPPISKQKSGLMSYYKGKISDREERIKKLTLQLEYLKSNYEMWMAYLDPKINISIVNPEPRKDKNGIKPKPYFRAISSFPYKGKKNQIMVYVATTEDFKAGIDNKIIEQKALEAIQKSILKKFPMALFLNDLEEERDSMFESEFLKMPVGYRERIIERQNKREMYFDDEGKVVKK
jgi:hypothetical protein